MRRRAARVMIVLLLVAGAAAAAYQAVSRSRALETAAATQAALTAAASRAEVALAEVAASQRAYVAPGQGLDFWAGKVDEALASAGAALAALQTAASVEGAAAVESAVSRLHDFAVMDRSVRDYVRESRNAMGADLIFADGYEIMAAASADVASAVAIEQAGITTAAARDRQLHLASVAALGACVLIAALLALAGPKPAEPIVATIAPQPFDAAPASHAAAAPDDAIGAALDASLEGLDAPTFPTTVDLPSAADVCVDLARLLDARDLQPVMARVASVLGADGVIVWMADAEGRSLAPALTHGYAPSLVARLGALSIDADNATAAACRSKATQVVEGALAVPLLTSGGCTGVLAVELKDGRERAGDVQSLARIVAAQLAATVSGPEAEARKAAEA
ncbi:MAG TPA: GAF domain-containing protein [Vicinamibacterales bacterium]|nr:GAF domain-containing protein [Vicinamibacterales bacterium]